jgi:hypothetical protein
MRLTAERKESKRKSENRRRDWNLKQDVMKAEWEKQKCVYCGRYLFVAYDWHPAEVNGFSLQHSNIQIYNNSNINI